MVHDYESPSREVLRWISQEVNGRVISVERLHGGITADMDRIAVDRSTGRRDVVLRRWPDDEQSDNLVRREAAALDALLGHDVPAPTMIAFDETGSKTGVRCTLTSALPGEPDLAPADLRSWLDQLATVQAAIHTVPVPAENAAAASDRYGTDGRALDWLADRGLRNAAKEAAAKPNDGEAVEGDPVLIHGDYQHFNVLWVDSTLTGVVDWPSATTGSRGTDVGHCRLNLAVLFDARTADDYLRRYEQAAGVRVDRRADLRALLCFDLEWQRFIPRQVAGRTTFDSVGMPDRVATVVRHALDSID